MKQTPLEALALLENATGQLQLVREDHIRLQLAVGVLKDFIEDNTTKPEESSDKEEN